MKKMLTAILGVVALVAVMLGVATAAGATGGQGDEPTCEDQYITQIVHHDAVTHIEFKYKQSVQDFKTKYQYQKQTKTQKRWLNVGNWTLVSDWSWWSPASTQWSFDNVAVLESGNHADWWEGSWKYDRDYRYVQNGVTEQVPDGSHFEYTDWTTDVLTDPWVKIDERTVTDQEAYDEEIQVLNPDYPCPTATPTPTPTPPVTETPTPTPTPTLPPVTETSTPTPPVETPEPSAPPTSDAPEPPRTDHPATVIRCVGNALVTTKTDAEGNIEHSTINGARECSVRHPEAPPVIEEGM